jgi:HSP20 family protein
MNLIPWRSQPTLATTEFPFTALRNEMLELFDRFFNRSEPASPTGATPVAAWVPRVDIVENDNEISIQAELPGVDTDDVELTVTGNLLTISGQREQSSEKKCEGYCYCERRYGSFRRSIELPDTTDRGKISAEHRNGVLCVHVPKAPGAEPRRINIRSDKLVESKPASTKKAAGKTPVHA